MLDYVKITLPGYKFMEVKRGKAHLVLVTYIKGPYITLCGDSVKIADILGGESRMRHLVCKKCLKIMQDKSK